MAKNKLYEIAFKLGAQSDSSMSKTFMSAKESIASLGKGMSNLQATSKKMDSWSVLGQKLRETNTQFSAAKEEVARLGKALRSTANPTAKMSREFEAARNKTTSLKERLQSQRSELHSVSDALKAAGVSTKSFSREQEKLQQNMARLGALKTKIQDNQTAIDVNAAKKNELKSKLFGSFGGMMPPGMASLFTLGSAVNISANFEQEMNRLSANGVGEEDRTKLEAFFKEQGAKTRFSALDAAQMGNTLKVAGFSPDEIMKSMPSIMTSSIASGMGLDEIAGIGADITRTFNKPVDEMGNMLGTITIASQKANLNVRQMAETFKYAAPIAEQLNVSEYELAAMTGILADNGIKGTQSGTAIRAMLTRLAGPTERVKEQLAELGVNADELFKDADGNILPMELIMSKLNKLTKNMGNADQMALFKKIFGEEAAAAALKLFEAQTSGKLKTMTAEIAKESGTVLKKMQKEMDKGVIAAFARLKSAGESVMHAIGDSFKGDLAKALDSLAGKIGAIGEWMEKNKEVVAWVTKAASTFIALRMSMLATGIAGRSVWNVFLKGRGVFYNLEAATYLFRGGLSKVTSEALKGTKTFKTWSKSVEVLKKHEKALNWAKSVADITKQKYASLRAAAATKVHLLAEKGRNLALAGGKWAWAMTKMIAFKAATLASAAATKIATLAQAGLSTAIGALTSPIGLTVLAIGGLVAAGVWLYKNWDMVKEKLGAAWDWIAEKASAVTDWISEKWNGLTGWISNAWDAVDLSGISNGLSTAWDATKNAASDAANWAVAQWNAIDWSGIGGKLSTAWDATKNAASDAANWICREWNSLDWSSLNWDSISTSFTSSFTNVGAKLGGIWNAAKTEGAAWIASLPGAFVDMIKSIPSKIGEAMKALVQSIKDYLKDAFTIDFSFAGGAKRSAEALNNMTHSEWNGYPIQGNAKGNIVSSPQISWIGEKGKEAIIPLEGPHKKRGMALWQAAGKDLGMFGASPAMAMTPGDKKPLFNTQVKNTDFSPLWDVLKDSFAPNYGIFSAIGALAKTIPFLGKRSGAVDATVLSGSILKTFIEQILPKAEPKADKKNSPQSSNQFNFYVTVGNEAQVPDVKEALEQACQQMLEKLESQRQRLSFA